MVDQALYHDPTTGGTVQLPIGSNHARASQTGNTSEYRGYNRRSARCLNRSQT